MRVLPGPSSSTRVHHCSPGKPSSKAEPKEVEADEGDPRELDKEIASLEEKENPNKAPFRKENAHNHTRILHMKSYFFGRLVEHCKQS